MAIGSDGEIGVVFTSWGKMTPRDQQIWFDQLRDKVERGNLLEGHATIGYPKRKKDGKENGSSDGLHQRNHQGSERWDVT